jgi:hypothetical protein
MRVPLTVCFQFPDPLGTVRVYVYSTWECTCKCACCFARSDKFGLSAGSATACNIHTLFTSSTCDTATVTLFVFSVSSIVFFYVFGMLRSFFPRIQFFGQLILCWLLLLGYQCEEDYWEFPLMFPPREAKDSMCKTS